MTRITWANKNPKPQNLLNRIVIAFKASSFSSSSALFFSISLSAKNNNESLIALLMVFGIWYLVFGIW